MRLKLTALAMALMFVSAVDCVDHPQLQWSGAPLGSPTPLLRGQTTFALPGTAQAQAVSIGDINGDGKPDLVVATTSTNIFVFLNTTPMGATTASFAAPVGFVTATGGNNCASVTVGEFTGSGKQDLVTTHSNFNTAIATLSLLVNTTPAGAGTPTFESLQYIAGLVSDTSCETLAGDFNGDLKPDLAVACGTLSVLLNGTPAGTFEAPANVGPDGFFINALTAADLTSDGKLDLIAGHEGPNSTFTLDLLVNTAAAGAATAGFAEPIAYGAGVLPTAVAVGDFNDDGKPDIALAGGGAPGFFFIALFLNNTPSGAATPTLADPVLFPAGSVPNSIAVADLNRDGKPDLAVLNDNDRTLSIYLNTTPKDGTVASFSSAITFPTDSPAGSAPQSLVTADFNGDGKPDLAFVNFEGNTVSVLLGQ